MATFASDCKVSKATRLFEKFCAIEIDRDEKKSLIELWSGKKEAKYVLPVFTEWLVKTVSAWSTTGLTPGTRSVHFALNLTALLCEDEDRFNQLNCRNFFVKLIKTTKARESKLANIKMAYVKLLSAFLDHEAGIEWSMGGNFWEDVLSLCLVSRDGCVLDASFRFVGKILEKTFGRDDGFCVGVIRKMMLPLGENIYGCVKSSVDVSDNFAVECFQPTLKMIGDVLEELLRGVYVEGKDFGLLLLFLSNFRMKERMYDLMTVAEKRCLRFDLSRIVFVMQFLQLYVEVTTTTTTLTKVAASLGKIRSNFLQNFLKGSITEDIEFSNFGLLYWKLMETKIPSFKDDSTPFSHNLTVLMILPNLCFLLKYLTNMADVETDFANDEIRDAFLQTLMEKSTPDVKRVFFAWRGGVVDSDNVTKICISCLRVLKSRRSILSRNQVLVVFKVLVYFLEDIIRIVRRKPEKIDVLVEQVPYLREVFESLGIFVNDFDLVWKDGFEVTYVMGFCFDFLGLTEWSSDTVMEVMKLVNVATAHYMAPNMALLLDETPDLTIALLGPLLYSKLLHESAKVRNATLDVVFTCSTISSNIVCTSNMETHAIKRHRLFEKFLALNIDVGVKKSLVRLWIKEKSTVLALTEWLVDVVDTWRTAGVALSTNTVTFVLKLSTMLCEDEERFIRLNNNNFFAKLIKATKARTSEASSVKIAYVRLLTAFLTHPPGVEWMVACNFWEDALGLCLASCPEVATESTSFVETLLAKTLDYDENFCDGVVKKIMVPLGESIYRCITASSDVNDDAATDLLQASLKFMGDVLEHFLKKVHHGEEDVRVLFLFLRNFHLEERICDFMIIAQNKRLLFDISKIMFVMQFLELYGNVVTKTITVAKLRASVDKIRKNFCANLFRGSFSEQINFCQFSYLFWRLMASKIGFCKSEKVYDYSDQLIGVVVSPIYSFFMKKYPLKLTEFEEEIEDDDFRNAYEQKVWSIVPADFARVWYFWFNRNVEDPDLYVYCEQALTMSRHCWMYFSRQQAIIYFQTLVYYLMDIVRIVDDNQNKIDILVREFCFCRQVFELVGFLIDKFQIVLRDGIESTYVISVCFDFLALTEWSSEVVVEIVKVIDIAIAHYSAPNMALLVEDTPDTTITSLGSFLYSKLLDKDPKVNQAALGTIYTTATISKKSKFMIMYYLSYLHARYLHLPK